jgi:UDP:flavonoid glycosyltransferase YjiC (YdhE family)
MLAALAREGCRVLCYLPEVAGGKAPPVTAPNLAYALRPVALQTALAEAQLCVCHAGEATVAQALLAGVPVLLLPMQLEQFLIARRIAAAGMGVNAAMLAQPLDWRQLVRHMLATPAYAQSAMTFAARHRGYSAEGMAARLALALER